MRRGLSAVVVLLGLTAVALFASSAPAVEPVAAKSCGSVTAPGYHVIITSVKGVSCRSAKKTIQSWIDDGAKPSSGPRKWRCKSKYSKLLWRCTRREDVIRFTRHRRYS